MDSILSSNICQFPYEILFNIFSHLDVKSLLDVSIVCTQFEAVSNDNELWKSHVEKMIKQSLGSETISSNHTSSETHPRASFWKIRYAQYIQRRFPDFDDAERISREFRRHIISLVLREVWIKKPNSNTNNNQVLDSKMITDFPDQESKNIQIEEEPDHQENSQILKYLNEIRYIPIRLAIIGDAKIGKTMTVMKYVRSYTWPDPIPDERFNLNLPPKNAFGSYVFNTIEYWNRDVSFSITIVDPPSNDIKAIKAALKGVDGVIIGFSFDNKESVVSVQNKWIPFVRSWLKSVPISIVGLRADTLGNQVSATDVFDILQGSEIQMFDIAIPPYKRCFCRVWTPPDCPLVTRNWI